MSLMKFFKSANANKENVKTGEKRKIDSPSEDVDLPSKKAKPDPVVEKNRKYDTNKRERKFQEHWLDTYKWMSYNIKSTAELTSFLI